MPRKLTESDVLAESLAEHAAYWDAQDELTSAQKRWRAFELELRTNMAADGQTPVTWLLLEIRSGGWEARQRRNMENALRSRARLERLRREGYTFDAEHRLIAPPVTQVTTRRGSSREARPQVRRHTASASRDGPRLTDESEPPPPLAACARCGGTFTPTGRGKFCSSSCRQAAYRLRRQVDATLVDAVWRLRLAGEIDGTDALLLLVAPPTRVLERLEVA